MSHKVETKTKLGKFVVDVASARVVHVVRDDMLTPNEVVYWAVIENFMGEHGVIKQGWTFTTTIDDSAFEMLNEFALLVNPKTTRLYPVHGGGVAIN